MAKCRIGHFVEAQILEALEVDFIDESEVLTPADVEHHVDKQAFTVPFVCGATNLGEALRRISEGAAMIRTKGEAGTGDIVNAVAHMRAVFGGIRQLAAAARRGALRRGQGAARAVRAGALGRPRTAACRSSRSPPAASPRPPTPRSACSSAPRASSSARASSRPARPSIDPTAGPRTPRRAKAIVEATTHYADPKMLARVSAGLGAPMVGISAGSLAEAERLEGRGW